MKKIKFFTKDKEQILLDFPELYPQPSRNFIPKWYKNMPINDIEETEKTLAPKLFPYYRTIKTCPSFIEIFNEGFVIVSPCDMWFKVSNNGEWAYETSSNIVDIEPHHETQFTKYAPDTSNVKMIFKIVMPWYAVAPKGYSLRQLPLIYDYNPDWHIPYGVIRADNYYSLNPQILITSKNEEILIKRGEPLYCLVPYKREKFKMDIVKFDDKLNKDLLRQDVYIKSSFRSMYHRYND